MAAWLIVLIVVVAVLVVAAVTIRAVVATRRRRRLQEHFGAEYDGVVEQTGDSKKATSVLQERIDERDKLDIRPLDPTQRDTYGQEWRQVQADFVDAPERSLREADGLVARVMRACGYPVDDFDRRADLVSVDHPDVVRHYRAAHEVFVASQGGAGVSTEQVRQAFVAYRALFSQLLGTADASAESPTRRM